MKIQHPPYRPQKGFTLIEVMIVVVIVAILSVVAYPSYVEYLRRGHRAEARTALLQAQHWLEQAATAQGVYPAPDSFPKSLTWVDDSSKHYTISMTSKNEGMDFTLKATRKDPGTMSDDKCGDYILTHTGEQSIENEKDGASKADCWRK